MMLGTKIWSKVFVAFMSVEAENEIVMKSIRAWNFFHLSRFDFRNQHQKPRIVYNSEMECFNSKHVGNWFFSRPTNMGATNPKLMNFIM